MPMALVTEIGYCCTGGVVWHSRRAVHMTKLKQICCGKLTEKFASRKAQKTQEEKAKPKKDLEGKKNEKKVKQFLSVKRFLLLFLTVSLRLFLTVSLRPNPNLEKCLV